MRDLTPRYPVNRFGLNPCCLCAKLTHERARRSLGDFRHAASASSNISSLHTEGRDTTPGGGGLSTKIHLAMEQGQKPLFIVSAATSGRLSSAAESWLSSGTAVDQFAHDVCVPRVPGRLLQQMRQHPAKVHRLRAFLTPAELVEAGDPDDRVGPC